MRFLVMVKGNEESEAGILPPEAFEEMGKFNEELVKAGMMLEAAGLLPSSTGGIRIAYDGRERTVTDGPFTEAKELVAGFWLWQARSKDEAIEWAKRIPFEGGEVEIRQIAELEDFGEDIPDHVKEQEQRLRQQVNAHQ